MFAVVNYMCKSLKKLASFWTKGTVVAKYQR